MPHMSELTLVERLRRLEDLQQRTAGACPPYPLVCGICGAPHDPKGCPCGRRVWVMLPVAIIELQFALREAHTNDTARHV